MQLVQKQRGAQNILKKLIIDGTEATDKICSLNQIKDFMKHFLKNEDKILRPK